MPKKILRERNFSNQVGAVAPILTIVILLVGLAAGLFLTKQTQIFKPKALESQTSPQGGGRCSQIVTSFSVQEACGSPNSFGRVSYTCGELPDTRKGDSYSCRPLSEWLNIVEYNCQNACRGNPTSSFSPEPAPIRGPCREYDGNLEKCNVSGSCSYYSCTESCWPKNTPLEVACVISSPVPTPLVPPPPVIPIPVIQPPSPIPISTTIPVPVLAPPSPAPLQSFIPIPVVGPQPTCSFPAPIQTYCVSLGRCTWVWESCIATSTNNCNQYNGDLVGCNNTGSCAYYSCTESCWPRDTGTDIACRH